MMILTLNQENRMIYCFGINSGGTIFKKLIQPHQQSTEEHQPCGKIYKATPPQLFCLAS